MRTGYAFAVAATLAITVAGAADTDYDQFISSLSYNWQNEFSDLRYQVAQLQQDDPSQYSQLAAALGLKAGATINVPSQYDPVWASKFVQAAGLYTPPAAPTFDPAQATPTAAAQNSDSLGDNLFASALQAKPSDQEDSDDSDSQDNGDDDSGDSKGTASHKSTKSSNSSKNSKSSSHHKTSSADDDNESDAGESLDDEDEGDGSTSQQFGNPIVGSLNTNDGPIIPSGQGYSGGTQLVAGFITLALPLLASSLF
ncbi:hypothetical protein LPJ53_004412 [Coemansia erecta]|uniref:Uncharacterized protein n=1 Tax=Coemansia erecta TaxID=147472 RepID=A0A9W7XUE4_9FUNG|nr:hypothetical protein LPJ53_004412 [Coemansia erecta]